MAKPSFRQRAHVLCSICLALAACSDDRRLSDDAIALNNRGVAQMGSFDYRAAVATFEALVAANPGSTRAQVNLAIAVLNRQQEGDVAAAMAMLDEALDTDPGDLNAHYVAGLLHLYEGSFEHSNRHLQRVIAADPDDAYARYFLAQNLLQASEFERALDLYRAAMTLDPYLRSAYYGASLALRRLDRVAEANETLALFERLANNPRARLAEFKYTRMGPRANAAAIGEATVAAAPLPTGPLFADPVDTAVAGMTAQARLTVADVDADGDLDLYVTGQPATHLLLNDGGDYRRRIGHPLDGLGGVAAAFWGDVDNDGALDVYLCARGINQLWLSDDAAWNEVGGSAGVADAGTCADGGLVDADHDGDLDIYVANADGADELYSNNLDGTFRRLMAPDSLNNPASARQFLATDLDGDRDVDLITLNEGAPHAVWINDRLWRYDSSTALEPLSTTPLTAAVAADLDADGSTEIYGIAEGGGLVRGAQTAERLWAVEPIDGAAADVTYLATADFDGDGLVDLLTGGPRRITVLLGGTSEHSVAAASDSEFGQAVVLADDPVNGPTLVAAIDGGLRFWQAGPGRANFVGLTLSGKETNADTMRSNASGIGTHVALRVHDRWTLTEAFDTHSGPGQSAQPLLLGLGAREVADYVAMNWSDGVFQTELSLERARIHRIEETQRQLSSCPVLFAWNGEGYGFVSDILGVGGLGFFAEPGVATTPRPWENFLLPVDALVARNGKYLLKVTEPMEENAYLDAVRLRLYDLPAGWDVVLDERMETGAPAVTGRAIFYRNTIPIHRAVDQTGTDVTRSLRETDSQAAPLPALDSRFIGRTASEHAIEIEFAEPINPQGSRPILVANGWIEYPYSQTLFGAWQAGATYEPPTLSARSEGGRWVTVYEAFGYPAGMPRTMALPLQDLPPDTIALRLSGNVEVYWDEIFVALEETPANVATRVIAPEVASLAVTGFPQRTTGAQRRPHYDYAERHPFWDARYLPGAYTRLGPVEALLNEVDDAVVIIGSGEEVHLEFDAAAPAGPGQHRRIVVESHGWAKDMDLYTIDGDSVGPLPTRAGDDSEHRRVLHEHYNVRYQSGH